MKNEMNRVELSTFPFCYKKKRRCRHDIFADVLKVCLREPLPRTAVMGFSNLTYFSLQPILFSLLQVGLLEEVPGKYRMMYFTTQKGKEYLNDFKEFESYIPLHNADELAKSVKD